MLLLSDPVEVFRVLELYSEETFDVTRPHLSVFRCDHELGVLVYCPDGNRKGPLLFLFPVTVRMYDLEADIHNTLLGMNGDECFEQTRVFAFGELRARIESRSASHFMFDAH